MSDAVLSPATASEREGLRLDDFARMRVELPDNDGGLRGKLVPAGKCAPGRPQWIADVLYCLTIADEVFDGPLCNTGTGYPDVRVVPDPATLRPVPWEPATGAILADVYLKEGDEPYPLCPRETVRRAERRLAALGLSARVALEFELFVLAADAELMREGRYGELRSSSRLPDAYSLRRWPDISAFVNELYESCDAYGAPIDTVHTELGFGALEVALQPASPLEAADGAARFKLACRAIAGRHGLVPTFMAKWNAAESGCSGHIHQSAWRGSESAFWDDGDVLSETGKAYLEGLLATVGDMSAFFGPNANSYRRPDPAMWAPDTATWGVDNRTACVRVCGADPGSRRLEHRRPGADLSVYHAIAACIGGGALGIERGLALRAEAPRDATLAENADRLPASLAEATRRLRGSQAAREIFGDVLVEHYAVSREEEINQVAKLAAAVPEWELRRYFETV